MKTVRVAQVFQPGLAHHIRVLPYHTTLASAIHHFAQDNALRSLFLVDEVGKLIGIVSRHDLLDWVRLQMGMPPGTSTEPLQLRRLRQLLRASTALDIASKHSVASALHVNETLADAVEKMARSDEVELPVVDDEGHIVGSLSLSRLLDFVLLYKASATTEETSDE